jgi:hypothetical protein
MALHRFSASLLIPAPAAKVYDIVADYREGHPRILPKPTFVSMAIERGGVGAGTVVNFQMRLMGRIEEFHSVITEREPGRVLVETNTKRGAVTTFCVEPREDGKQSYVEISTETQVPEGFRGRVQGWLTKRLLRPIYIKELKQLAELVKI